MKFKLAEKLKGIIKPPELQEELIVQEPDEGAPPELFQLYKNDHPVTLVGMPQGATAEQVESLYLIRVGAEVPVEHCQDFIKAIQEALPAREANKIVLTHGTPIDVFRWKKL